MADGDGQAPGHRPAAAQGRARAQARRDRSRAPSRAVDGARPRSRPRVDDDVGDDLLRLDLHRLPPGPEPRGAGRPHAAAARRPDDRRDRPRVPRPGADHRPAHRPGEADAAEARVPFEVPRADELASRLASVLEVVYLIFNEGYAATAGDDWMRPGAVRRGAAPRPGAGRARCPRSPRCTGSSRSWRSRRRARAPGSARRASRSCCSTRTARRWDQLLIRRGLAALERAERLGGALGPVRAAGRDRGLPRPGRDRRGDRLGADRRALRRARRARAVADRRAQPGGRGRRWPSGRRPAWRRRRARRRAGARRATTCCRASAATCSPSSAGAMRRRGVPPGGRADPQRA